MTVLRTRIKNKKLKDCSTKNMKTDYASEVLKVMVPFLSHWFIKLMAEFTLYGRVGLVGFAPNVPSG